MNRKLFLMLIAAISALGGLLFGYDTGVINGAQYYLSQYFELDDTTKGWVVGSAVLACGVGAIIAAPLSVSIGRKYSLIISAILFTISAWGSGLPDFLPQTVTTLVIFRMIGGLGIGIASMNAPMYIAEIAPPKSRGNLVSYYQLAIVVGFFVVFLITYLIGNSLTEQQNINFGWRRMFWSELIPCMLFLSLLFIVPKSPRWLSLKGKNDEALKILKRVIGDEEAELEMVEIKKSIAQKDKKKSINYLAKGVLGIIIIGSVLSALQQFTGINAVLYYGSDIFKTLGFEDPLKQQLLLAGVNLAFTFVAMGTVDKFGRKPLLYIGSIGMILGFLILGISIKTDNLGILSLIGVLIFIASFAMSMGPVVWVMLSEMFPNKIRSVAMAVAVAAQWFSNYFIAQMFPIVVGSEANNNPTWNGSMVYFIFIGFIIFIILFTYKFIPETKGKSLEELEKIWEKN